MSLGSSGLHLRSRLAAGWTSGFFRGASKPPANARPPSFPKSTTSSLNRGVPPTRLAFVLLLPPPSPPLTALKRRDTSTCPRWMSQWPRISARPRLSDGRRGRLVRRGVGSAHQLPRDASSVPCLSILPAGHKGTPCANTLRQHVRGVIHKSPGRPRLEAPLHAGEKPSRLGSDQSALTEGDACAGQNEPRSRHVVKEQRLLRGMDAPPTRGSENLESLWQSLSRPLRFRRQLSLPNLFHKEHGCPGPRVAQPSALCVPSNRSATAGTQTSQGTTAQASSNSPPLEEPAVGVRIIPAARGSPLAYSLETRPPLSSERHAMASMARVMGPACVAAQREPFDLPERVLNTMAEARAPSTRRLYALKWPIFSAWCQGRDVDPVTSDVSVVLSFMQEMLDKRRSSSTIKVYAAAIAAFHAPIAGRSVGRNSAVVQFIRGAR